MRTDIRARRGQLITTYGIGSLFPAENSSYIVQGTHLWKEEWLRPVAEPRLARKLRVQGFRTPPATPSDNARPNIPVALFPRLFTCPNCGALGQLRHLTRTAAAAQCEMCDKKPVLTPSRFVVTCETGHLDDFPFYHWVHGRFPDPTWWKTPYKTNGHRLRLRSQGKSSGLGDLTASCSCGESRTMEGAFSKHALQKMPCGGKRLWLGFDQHEKCEKTPRALQRGASNVWFGATASAISIPPHSGRLAHVVASEADGFVDYSTEDLMPPLNEYAVGGIRHIRNRYRLTETFEEIAEAIARLIHPEDQPELSNHDFRFEEYQAILQGAPGPRDNNSRANPCVYPTDMQHGWPKSVSCLDSASSPRSTDSAASLPSSKPILGTKSSVPCRLNRWRGFPHRSCWAKGCSSASIRSASGSGRRLRSPVRGLRFWTRTVKQRQWPATRRAGSSRWTSLQWPCTPSPTWSSTSSPWTPATPLRLSRSACLPVPTWRAF